MPVNQSLRRRAFAIIYVGAQPVTDAMDPYLLNVKVVDRVSGRGLDTCSLELDDRDARLAIPPDNTVISVWLGWATSGPVLDAPPPEPPGSAQQLSWGGDSAYLVFRGRMSSVESAFARGTGRRMFIEAIGSNLYNYGKEPMLYAVGAGEVMDSNGNSIFGKIAGGAGGNIPGGTGGGGGGAGGGIPFLSFMTEVLKRAGYSNVQMSPDIGQTMRNYWFQGMESAHNALERYSSQLGYQYKIQGDSVQIFGNDSLPNYAINHIDAYWGINLISWRIRPFMARPQFAKGKSVWFDMVNGIFQQTERTIGGNLPFGRALATAALPNMAPNRQVGDQSTNAIGNLSLIQRGGGWAMINGEPRARALSVLNIVGARPGVDGQYTITEAEHNYVRNGGYTTRCMLEKPYLYAEHYKAFGWSVPGVKPPVEAEVRAGRPGEQAVVPPAPAPDQGPRYEDQFR